MIWIGPRPFPYERYRQSWAATNPGWDVQLWTDANLPPLRNQDLYESMDHLPFAVRVDLLRLELLARYGGLYTDADSECLRSLTPLIRGYRLFGMTGNKGNVANGTLGAEPAHPAYRRLVDGMPERFARLREHPRNRRKGWQVFDLFGTRYITPVLREYPEFVQIDAGERRGSRKLICVKGIDVGRRTVIAHDNRGSWKSPDRDDNRIHL